jgi:hypothetical protein
MGVLHFIASGVPLCRCRELRRAEATLHGTGNPQPS